MVTEWKPNLQRFQGGNKPFLPVAIQERTPPLLPTLAAYIKEASSNGPYRTYRKSA